MDSILYRGRKLEIYGQYDTVVIGSGSAGAAAAIRAAQLGCSTLVSGKDHCSRWHSGERIGHTYDEFQCGAHGYPD